MACPDAEALSAMAFGGLGAEQRASIADHAASCASCHAALDALLRSRGDPAADPLASTLGVDPAAAPDQALASRAGSDPAGASGPPPPRDRPASTTRRGRDDAAIAETAESAEPAADRPRARALAAGDHVDRYVIEAVLGSGGMGVVYRARDPELGRAVAIKVLRRGMGGERLRREAQALAKLSHPNVVAVHDVGTHDGQPFITMALVDGDTLRNWLRSAPRTRRAVLDVLLAAGRGIAAAHEVGLIHRDLKPDNIFVAHDGQVLVGDFGLARGIDSIERTTAATATAAVADRDAIASALTRSGMVLGTPAYMAPEQAAGGATIASDQFSFCVTAWEAFTRIRPFAGATTGEILDNIRTGAFSEPADERALPPRIGAALRRGLAADPARRFPSMAALLRALEPVRPTRRLAAAGALAVAAAATIAIVIAQQARSPDPSASAPALVCGGEARLLADDWDAARRGEVERALAQRPGSAAMTAYTLGLLDRFAQAWVEGRRAACEAARAGGDRQVYAEQVECFDRVRHELRLVADALRAPGGPESSVATELVETTPPVERCGNLATLVHVTPPDPARRAAIDRVRAALVRGRVAAQLRTVGSRPALDAVRAEVEAIGYLPLVGELARTEAMVAYDRDDYAAAEAAARRALAIADQLRDDLSRSAMAALVAWILARQGKFEGAAEQIAAAEAAWVRAGKDPWIEIEILVARADVARIQNLPDRVAATERMVDRVRQVYGPRSIRLAKALMTLAPMYGHDHKDQAQRVAHEASEIWSLQAGSTDQAMMTAINKVDAAKQAGDLRLMIERQIEVVAIVAAAAPGGDDEALVLYELGSYYEQATRWDDATRAYRRSLESYDRRPESDRQLMFDSLVALGRMEVEAGRTAAATALLERARAMVTRTLPANRDDVAILDVALGRAYAAAGRNAEAIAVLDPLVEPLRKLAPPRHLRFGLVCSTLATAWWAIGGTRDRERARALAGDARAAWTAAIAELSKDPLRGDQVRLTERRQRALGDWIAAHR